MLTKDRGTSKSERIAQIKNLQLIIEQLARGELTDEEAKKQLEEIWEGAYSDEVLREIIREVLPSLSRKK
jgi:hypothetical protein